MKIRPVGRDELFRADTTKQIFAFLNFSTAPKKHSCNYSG